VPSLLTATPARRPLYLLLAVVVRIAEIDITIPAGMGVVLLHTFARERIASRRYPSFVHSESPFLWAGPE